MSEDYSELRKKTLSGLIWRFGERFSAQIVSFLVSIVLARILMPSEYGIIAIVTIFINIANVFVTNGLGTSLVQKKDADDLDFSTMYWASLVLAIIMYGILFCVAPIIASLYSMPILIMVIRVMAIRLPLAAVNSIQQAYVSRQMIYKKFFFATLFGTIISAIVGIGLAILKFGVWALVAQYLTNVIIDTLVLFLTIKWKPKFYFSFEKFKVLFSFGWKVMVTGLIGTLFDQLRSFIIGLKFSSADLAFCNKGEHIPNLVANNINSSMESVLFSSISKVQDNMENVKRAVSRLMKTSSFIIMPLMFGLSGIADTLIPILLTEKWVDCIPYLRIICVQQCFSILNTVNLQAIKAVGRSDISLKLEFVKKPLYIGIIILMLNFGPLAICFGNALYAVIAIFINSFPNRKLLKYTLLEQLKDISIYFIISLIMEIIVIFIGYIKINIYLRLFLQILCGAVVYIGVARILKLESYVYVTNIIKDFYYKTIKKTKKIEENK